MLVEPAFILSNQDTTLNPTISIFSRPQKHSLQKVAEGLLCYTATFLLKSAVELLFKHRLFNICLLKDY